MREFWGGAKGQLACLHGERRGGQRTIRWASLRNSSAVSRLKGFVGGASWPFKRALNAVVKLAMFGAVPSPEIGSRRGAGTCLVVQ